MKNTIFIIVFLLSLTGFSQEGKINWISIEEAMAAQEKEPRKIIIDMYTIWCGPCKMMDVHTFQNKDLADYINKNYYAVKFNAEGNSNVTFKDKSFKNPGFDASRKGRNSSHEFARYFGVSAYPTVLFLDESGSFLLPVRGFHKPKQLEIYLKIFATNDYKKVTTKEQWKDYLEDFKPAFKE